MAVLAAEEVSGRRIASALVPAGLDSPTLVDSVDSLLLSVAHGRHDAVVVVGDGTDEVPLVEGVHSALPGLPLVLVGHASGWRLVRKALGAGAHGFVSAAEVETALAATVRAVCAGQLAMPASLRSQFDKPSLSHREKQVLGMVVLGMTNNEIASRLYLAESTVKSHLTSAFGKLGVRSRSEATTLILDPESNLGIGILAITQSPTGSGAGA